MSQSTLIYLIRHGETDYNSVKRFQGSMDIPLNEKGMSQSKALAKYLQNVSFDAIYASDLVRAVQTAEPLALQNDLPVLIDPRLREISYGEWEGMMLPDIATKYPAEMALWRESTDKLQIPGGESFSAAAQRSMTALTYIAQQNKGKTIAVFTHGGIVRLLLSGILSCSFHSTWSFKQDNCAINIFEFDHEKFNILLLNHSRY